MFKKSAITLGFNDFWLWFLGIIVFSLFIPIAFFAVNPFTHFNTYLAKIVISLGYVSVFWTIHRQVMIYFRKRYTKNEDYFTRIFWQTLTILFLTFPTGFICDYLICNVLPFADRGNAPFFLQIIMISLVVSITVIAIYESIFAIQLWKKGLVDTEKLKKENYRAQLETLKSQVNPHFLFNSLNTLSSTIHDDPDLAVDFVQNLSKVYRYVLETKNKEFVLLEDELEGIRHYIFLLEARFGEKLNISIDISPEDGRKYIVPLSLQMLIENAVKHNVVSMAKPLLISIYKGKDENLIVQNNLQLKDQPVGSSTKTGLENINKRYSLLSGKAINKIVTKEYFRVVLPLVQIGEYEP